MSTISAVPATTTLDRSLRDVIRCYHTTLDDEDFLAAARLAANLGEGDCHLDLEYMLNVVYQCRTARQITFLQREAYQTILAWATDATDQDLAFVDLIATLDTIDPDRQACSTRTQPRSGLLAIAHGVADVACFAWSHPRIVGVAYGIASTAALAIIGRQARRKQQAKAVHVVVDVQVEPAGGQTV